jgi:thermitase
MEKIHNVLLERSSNYAKWHNNPSHGFVHWASFLVIVSLVATGIFAGIGNISLEEEVLASSGSHTPTKSFKSQLQIGGVLKEAAQDRILVKFKDTTTSSKKNQILTYHGLKEKSEIPKIKVKIISIPSDHTPEEAIDRLLAQDRDSIEFAEVDSLNKPGFTPNDPYFSSQWEHPNTNAPQAWDTVTGEGLVIGIADTGVDCLHADLFCVPGWNVVDNNDDARDVYGHGTAVAGTAAAVGNNGIGVAGKAWAAKIMPVRVAESSGAAYDSKIASGITWAADRGAKVVNNSYQTSGSFTVQQAGKYLKSKGGLLTVSEGNYSSDQGAMASPDLISVSATDPENNLYGFSSFGNDTDVSAPGCVTTTSAGGGYSGWCGTSFSAPATAGVLALIFAAKPSLTPAQAENILVTTAKDLGTGGWDKYYGWGRIDAGASVFRALSSSSSLDTLAPSAPSGVKALASDSNRVVVSWMLSTDNVGVDGYRVYRDGSLIATTANTSYTDTSVSPLTTYVYTVRAYDAAQNISGPSNEAMVTTPVTQVSITSMQISSKTSSSATVKWTTNIPSSGSVFYGTNSVVLDKTATDGILSTAHTVTLTGLNSNTKYFYKIMFTSGDNTSSASSAVSNFRTSGGGKK